MASPKNDQGCLGRYVTSGVTTQVGGYKVVKAVSCGTHSFPFNHGPFKGAFLLSFLLPILTLSHIARQPRPHYQRI